MNIRTLIALSSLVLVTGIAQGQARPGKTEGLKLNNDHITAADFPQHISRPTGLHSTAHPSGDININFEDLNEGDTVAEQYAGQGAHFVPNIFAGQGNPFTGFPFADNTGMTVTGSDYGFLYDPTGVQNTNHNVLHSFTDWLFEDGDPNFAIFLDQSQQSASADIIADSSGVSFLVGYTFDGTNYNFAGLVESTGSQNSGIDVERLTLSGVGNIDALVVLPGWFGDWVAVDNFVFTNGTPPVPEPGVVGLFASGLLVSGGFFLKRRRRA